MPCYQHGGRGGGNRTPNLRFWRPTLCQLSYTPKLNSPAVTHKGHCRPLTSFANALIQTFWSESLHLNRLNEAKRSGRDINNGYAMILATTPAPTVRPPSRIAKRRPSSIAIGLISFTVIETLSPGITISLSFGNSIEPVTSVVRK